MIQVLVLTDGDRDKFAESVSSFKKNLRTSLRMQWVAFNSKTDDEFPEWARQNFPWLAEIRQGQGRYQLREAWDSMDPNTDYVIQFDDEHELSGEFDVDTAISFIDDHPYLAQLVLTDLNVVGGTEVKDVRARLWTEHALGWSTEPSIYRRAITDLGWPIGRHPHARFSDKLQRNSKSWRYAYLNA